MTMSSNYLEPLVDRIKQETADPAIHSLRD